MCSQLSPAWPEPTLQNLSYATWLFLERRRLGSSVAVTVASVGSCSSSWAPGLEISIRHRCSLKKKKKKKKTPQFSRGEDLPLAFSLPPNSVLPTEVRGRSSHVQPTQFGPISSPSWEQKIFSLLSSGQVILTMPTTPKRVDLLPWRPRILQQSPPRFPISLLLFFLSSSWSKRGYFLFWTKYNQNHW